MVEWKSLLCNLEWGQDVPDNWKKATVVLAHEGKRL